jgi:ABC-type glycerol-3-phosphate transport system substrate-binding protein
MSKFQIILLVIFGAFIILGVISFSFFHGNSTPTQNVVVWGPFPQVDIQKFLQSSGLYQDHTLSVNYFQVSPNNFNTQFTEALAEGRGPDLVILTQDQMWQERNKLTLVPYSVVKQSEYQATFVDEGDIFTGQQGLLALPMLVDPLVLYTNRDLLNGAAVAEPPAYWDQLYDYAKKLTLRDQAGNIKQSLIALGEAANIPHSKDILSLLMLQAGTPITNIQGGVLTPELTNQYGLPEAPGIAALNYYTQFANPQKPFYSWNRSLTNAQTNFVSGSSALYIGYSSELPILKAKNPNLSIGVTHVPQSRVVGRMTTFGKLYGIAIVKTSPNPSSDLMAIEKLISTSAISALSSVTGLAPARRDLLSNKPGDGVAALFYDGALQAKGWLDPDPAKTELIFDDMISAVTSGRALAPDALLTADGNIRNITGSQ